MTDAWRRGERDASVRSPLQGGEPAVPAGPAGDEGERADRCIRVGDGPPSADASPTAELETPDVDVIEQTPEVTDEGA